MSSPGNQALALHSTPIEKGRTIFGSSIHIAIWKYGFLSVCLFVILYILRSGRQKYSLLYLLLKEVPTGYLLVCRSLRPSPPSATWYISTKFATVYLILHNLVDFAQFKMLLQRYFCCSYKIVIGVLFLKCTKFTCIVWYFLNTKFWYCECYKIRRCVHNMRRICHWVIIQKDPMEGQDLLEGRAQSMHGARLAFGSLRVIQMVSAFGG